MVALLRGGGRKNQVRSIVVDWIIISKQIETNSPWWFALFIFLGCEMNDRKIVILAMRTKREDTAW
jgi:hypothetical protein